MVLLENNPSSHVQGSVHPPYSDFKMLRRLVLNYPLINNVFTKCISRLPYLTHLVLIDPKWSPGSPPELFQAGKSLQMVALVLQEIGEWYATSLMMVGDFLKPSRDGLDVRIIKLRAEDVYSQGRIHEWVCSGMVWEF
jgi:hypothetical protein